MKKIFCILLAVLLFAMLTACGCSTDANVEGEAGNNSRMYGDGIYDGDNERTNDGSMRGGASAEFDIYGGNNTNGNNGTNGNGGNTAGNGSSRRTSSIEKGELSQLASLVGADDFKVIEILGEGDSDTVINGNIAIVKRRTYYLPIFGRKENVILSYDKEGLIDNIEISPDYAPIIWTLNITNEFGNPEKVSTNGLDYQYYVQWRSEKNKIELICWNDKLSVQISGK